MEKKHILFAYNINQTVQNQSPIIQDQYIEHELRNDGLTWVHLDLNHTDTRGWLEQHSLHLDPLVIDALLADETRPRITFVNDGIFINLRGVNLKQGANPSDMVSIRLWIDKTRIVSVQRRDLKAIYDIENIIANQTQKQNIQNSGDFICLLIEKLLFDIAPQISTLEEKMDTTEETVINKPEKGLRENMFNQNQSRFKINYSEWWQGIVLLKVKFLA